MRWFGILLVTIFILFTLNESVLGEDGEGPAKVAVLALQAKTEGQYGYLNDAVRQMLIARLDRQENIEIVDTALLIEKADSFRKQLASGSFEQLQQQLGADILLDGTLYSLRDGIQLNMTSYSLWDEFRQTSLSVRVESAEEIISSIGNLADQISGELAGRGAESADVAVETGDGQGMSGFQTPHPERDYRKGLFAGATLFGDDKDDRFQSKGIRKSSTIPITIETVAQGDLDGDGVHELVVSSRSRLRIFAFSDRRFKEVAKYNLDPNYKIHVINIADPGDSGKMRLFVSANRGKSPASLIFEWDGSDTLQLLQGRIGYYIRPLWWPGKGVILAGQQDSPNISDNFLYPGVFELVGDVSAGTLSKGDKLLLPKGTNLFDFIVADLNGDGDVETMVIDQQQKLLVYDAGLNLSWVSSASYGGSKSFFGPAISEGDKLDPRAQDEELASQRRLIFIPGRLDLKDITGDGLPEVVVSTNDVGIDKWFENVRSYDGGAVACLTWRGGGLMELWRTNHIEGYVADYAFDPTGEPVENGRLVRLYVAQIPDSTFWDLLLPGKNDSKVLAYEMTVKNSTQQPSP